MNFLELFAYRARLSRRLLAAKTRAGLWLRGLIELAAFSLSLRKNVTASASSGHFSHGQLIQLESLEELNQLVNKHFEISEDARTSMLEERPRELSDAPKPPPAKKNAASSPECAKEKAVAEQLIFENRARIDFLIRTPLFQGGCQFWDPQCDNPLDPVTEQAIAQMSPSSYLRWIIKNYNVEIIGVLPESEYECLRTARKAVRNIPEYSGERFIQ